MTPLSPYPVSWRLTPLESKFLRALQRARGGALSKEQILVCIYGVEVDVEIKMTDVLACKVRKKLAPYGIEIVTFWGQGFGLTLDSLPIIRDAMNGIVRAQAEALAEAA